MDNKAKWHCEHQDGDEKHQDSGFMIICEAYGLEWPYLIRDEVLKTAHDPEFLFWSAVRGIKRAIAKHAETHANERHMLGLRKHLDKLLSTGWRVSCRDPLCIACGDRSATIVEGMLIEQQMPGLRRVGDVYERVGVSHG